ncbi:hypothetical protein OTU49_015165, partial [Cherax quadricarinatus]
DGDEQIVTPRTPWNSPVLKSDVKDQNRCKEEKTPQTPLSSVSSKLIKSPLLNKFEASCEGYLCRIHAPPWLMWQPKIQAFICNFENKEELQSQVNLMLDEPNPEEDWYVVRPHHSSTPEVGEERVLEVPRGMLWVRTSSSGFLVTKARFNQLTTFRPLPSTWR